MSTPTAQVFETRPLTSDELRYSDLLHRASEETSQPLSDSWTSTTISSHDEDLLKKLDAEELIKHHEKYNDKISNLRYWLESPYIGPAGSRFICAIVCIAGDLKSSTALEDILRVEKYLRLSCLHAVCSSSKETPQCPTEELLDPPYTHSIIAISAESQNRSSSFGDHLLQRDRLRCQLTRALSENIVGQLEMAGDDEQLKKLYSTATNLDSAGDVVVRPTEGAHILPFKLGNFNSKNEKVRFICWESLTHVFPEIREIIGLESQPEVLDDSVQVANDVNSLANGITMDSVLHKKFDAFAFGLAHMGDDRYKVVNFKLSQRLLKLFQVDEQGVRTVYFQYADGTQDKEKVAPELLTLHLALAQIFNLIAAAEPKDLDLSAGGSGSNAATWYPIDGRSPYFGDVLSNRLKSIAPSKDFHLP